MKRIKKEYQHTIEIEKSKFLCHVNRCFSEQEAKEYIAVVKKQHPNANHHCYAYVIGEHQELTRSNDDGEPSGTAGSPMLESLRLSGISDCVCVVVRYFGGIKLGTGGLVRAYSSCVSETIKLAPKVSLQSVYHYQMKFGYELLGKIEYLLTQKNAIILEKKYSEFVVFEFYIPEASFVSSIQEWSSGQTTPQLLGQPIIELES